MAEPENDRIRIREVTVLSDDYYLLKKTTLDYRRSDGNWQTFSRETYDRGNGAVILPYNKRKRSVVLVRQFRYPAFANGHPDGMLIEACAGLLDTRDPETCIKKEVEEETGLRLDHVTPVFQLFMSPGSVTERLHFFVAEYEEVHKSNAGGGIVEEGEDIERIEVSIDDALAMIARGEIVDGKTVILILFLNKDILR